jgi:hypothetical protein
MEPSEARRSFSYSWSRTIEGEVVETLKLNAGEAAFEVGVLPCEC